MRSSVAMRSAFARWARAAASAAAFRASRTGGASAHEPPGRAGRLRPAGRRSRGMRRRPRRRPRHPRSSRRRPERGGSGKAVTGSVVGCGAGLSLACPRAFAVSIAAPAKSPAWRPGSSEPVIAPSISSLVIDGRASETQMASVRSSMATRTRASSPPSELRWAVWSENSVEVRSPVFLTYRTKTWTWWSLRTWASADSISASCPASSPDESVTCPVSFGMDSADAAGAIASNATARLARTTSHLSRPAFGRVGGTGSSYRRGGVPRAQAV